MNLVPPDERVYSSGVHVAALKLDNDGNMLAVALDIGALCVWTVDSLRQGSSFPSDDYPNLIVTTSNAGLSSLTYTDTRS